MTLGSSASGDLTCTLATIDPGFILTKKVGDSIAIEFMLGLELELGLVLDLEMQFGDLINVEIIPETCLVSPNPIAFKQNKLPRQLY